MLALGRRHDHPGVLDPLVLNDTAGTAGIAEPLLMQPFRLIHTYGHCGAFAHRRGLLAPHLGAP